jgi:hypothetical protein
MADELPLVVKRSEMNDAIVTFVNASNDINNILLFLKDT